MKNFLQFSYIALLLVCFSTGSLFSQTTIPVDDSNIWTEYISNPLFGGPTDGVDRGYYPFVLKAGSTYHIWYGDGTNTRHATSASANFSGATFPAPICSGLPAGAYHPRVLYNASGWTVGGNFYAGPFLMYSTTGSNWALNPRVAHSADGDSWTDIGPTTGVIGPDAYYLAYNFDVLYEGGTIWKAYADNGWGWIQYYTSTDGLNWNGVATNIVGPPLQPWETATNTSPRVIKVDDYYVIFYGSGTTANNQAIGMAMSNDGQNFTKSIANPLLSITGAPAWRDNRTYTPCVFQDDTDWKLYFTGRSTVGGNYSIGYATSGGLFQYIEDAMLVTGNGDIVDVGAGTYNITSTINLNKPNLTFKGAGSSSTIMKVSGTGERFNITAAGTTLRDLQIEKTDKVGVQNIIGIYANNTTIKNNIIHGQYEITPSSYDSDVSRAMIVSGGLTGLQIEGNTFYSLRQPGYFSGPTTGNIINNYTYSTKGWVMEGGDMTFTGNTWGSGAQTNVYDIAILSTAPPTAYTDIVAISNANNEAVIEDQRVSPAVLSIAYVDASTSYSSDLGGKYHPYSSITPAITRVVAGGKIKVADGTYDEDVIIPKNLSLFSMNGQTATIVNGQTTGWGGGALRINSSNVTVGGVGKGFTFNGKSGGTSTISFACYISGARDNLWIEENKFVAAPKDPGNNETHGLLTDGGQTNQTYKNNIFDGMSTPRFLVYVNGFADVGVASTNIDFIGNTFNTLAGGLTLSSSGGEVTGNYFQGTAGIGLNTSSSNVISGNFFQGVGNHLSNHTSSGVDVDAFIGANTFDKRVVIRNAGAYRIETFPWGPFIVVRGNIQGAINAASAGDSVIVSAGTYTEALDITKSVTILGPNAAISPNTGSRVAEAIIDLSVGTREINMHTNNITLNGFEIINSANAGAIMAGTFSGHSIVSGITIEKNFFHDLSGSGIATTASGTAMTGWVVNDNKINNTTFGTYYGGGYGSGIKLWGVAAIVTNNVLSNIGFTGIDMWGAPSTVSGNSIANTFDNGIQLVGSSPTVSGVTISSNTITNANTANVAGQGGIKLFGSPNNINITDNIVTGSKNGFAVEPGNDLTGKTIAVNNNNFAGNSSYGVYHGGTGTLNATCNWYGTAVPAEVVSKISGAVDFFPFLTSASGPCDGMGPVVDITNDPDRSYMTIQDAINAPTTLNGDVITVAAGTYNESVQIGKAVTLAGAGKTQTIVQPTVGLITGVGHKYDPNMTVAMFVNNTTGVTIKDMTIDGNEIGLNAVVFWNSSSGTLQNLKIMRPMVFSGMQSGQGLAVDATIPGSVSLNIDNCEFEQWNKNAIDIVNGNGTTSNGGNITFSVNGGTYTGRGNTATTAQNCIVVWERGGGTINGSIQNASFSDVNYIPTTNEASAILQYGSPNGTISPISGCSFTNTELYVGQSTGSNHTITLSGNSYDGVNPSSATFAQLVTIEDKINHIMDDNTTGLITFRANTVVATPNNLGIQQAVGVASSGDSVLVGDGTYEEQVEINKQLYLRGQSMTSTIVKSPVTLTKFFTTSVNNYPILYVHDIAGVSIADFTIDGFGRGNGNYRFQGIGFRNAGGTVSGCTIKDVRETPINGTQHGVGIYAYADNGIARTLYATNNTIYGFQKNGTAFNGPNLTVIADNNTITGAGAVDFIAQNCLQIGFGATGSLTNNNVSNVSYTPSTDVSCGMLLYQSGGTIQTLNNIISNTQVGIDYINVGGEIKHNNVTISTGGVGTTSFWGIIADPGELQRVNVQPFDMVSPSTEKPVRAVSTITALTTMVDSNIVTGDGINGVGIEADALGTETLNFSANENTVSGWGTGFVLYKETGATLNSTLRRNSITGNKYGVLDQSGVLQDAKENWWGSSTGPADPKPLPAVPDYNNTSGIGDSVSSFIDYNPWYLDAGMTSLSLYTLTLNATNGSVDVTPPTGPYNHGTILSLVPLPSIGYYFVNWSGADVPIGHTTDNPLSLTMDANKTITANFAIYTYTLTINATNGSVNVTPPTGPYNHGTILSLAPVPIIGYHFVDWSGADVPIGHTTDDPLSLTMDANKTITANFAINTYTLTVNAAHGTVQKIPDQLTYDYGTPVQLIPLPAIDYHFNNWTGDFPVGHGSDNPLTVVMNQNRIITAVFLPNISPPTYIINATAGACGSISPSGILTFDEGENQTFIMTPDPHYHIDTVYVDGVSLGVLTNYTFNNIVTDHTIHAVFALDKYTATVNVTGSGTVTKIPDQTEYNYGTVVQLQADASIGWKFSYWSGDGSGTANPYNVTIDGNKNITAVFAEDSLYLISYRSFTPESLALDKDNKGKINKYVLKKPVRVYFECTIPNSTIKKQADFHIHFNPVLIGGNVNYPLIITPTPTSMSFAKQNTILNVSWSDSILPGETIKITGWGAKGKAMKISYAWKIFGGSTHYDENINPVNQLYLPMPNRVNALYEAFRQGGYSFTSGLLVGLNRKSGTDSSQYYGWLQSKSYKNVLQSLVAKKGNLLHFGAARGFDKFTNGRYITKAQKIISPEKHNNILLAEMIALKVNITASALGITPRGFGELKYDDGTSNPLNGLMLKVIGDYGDELMMGVYDEVSHKKLFADQSLFNNLSETLHRINSAFEGEMDTVSFADALIIKGAKRLIDVPFLRANPLEIPTVIIPLDNPEHEMPSGYALDQNYPNPFNPSTVISYQLPVDSWVTLKIFNMLGQEVKTLIDNQLVESGVQDFEFDANGLSSGVYFYRLIANGLGDEEEGVAGKTYTSVKKMILLR